MSGENKIPLVVDLDGTITPVDTLTESCLLMLKKSPIRFLECLVGLRHGKAAFKESIAEIVEPNYVLLPLRDDVIAYLSLQKELGRRIILATAAHRKIAEGISNRLNLFDEIIATEGGTNLKGEAKLNAIRNRIGNDFEYIGDSYADIPIWSNCAGSILVGVSRSLKTTVASRAIITREFPGNRSYLRILKSLRPHQWLKNLLLFVPVFTSFALSDPGRLQNVLIGFTAFSLAASATYIANDLWDIESDRAHPRKRNRPFASGQVSIESGILTGLLCFIASLLLANSVSVYFLAALGSYLFLTTVYTGVLKRVVVVDVVVLSCLYTWRVFSGSIASSTPVSSWLLAFSLFLFLGLAVVKRCSELVLLRKSGKQKSHGRDYRVEDLEVLWPLGLASSLSAIVVFGLFISSAETKSRYLSSDFLWLVAVGLMYWLSRIWIKTSRGEMNDDPLVFAVIDRVSRYTLLSIMLFVVAARFLEIPILKEWIK